MGRVRLGSQDGLHASHDLLCRLAGRHKAELSECSMGGNLCGTGCGMAFLSWLMSQGYALDAIARAMVSLKDSGTLAQLYANLSGDAASQAWPKFTTAVNALPDGVTSDDPFAEAPHAAQVAHLDSVLIGFWSVGSVRST